MTQANETEEILDAEEELKRSAAQRPTRQAQTVAPIEGTGEAPLAAREVAPLPTTYRDASREITREDIRVPAIKLSQSMSGVVQSDEMKAGNWYYTLDNREYGPKIKVVAFDVYKSRAYMIQGAGLSCRSVDMYIGIGDPGGDCLACGLKDWPPQGQKGGPKCRINYNFPVAVIPEDWEPGMGLDLGLIRLNGTSAPAGQNMIGLWDSKKVPWHQIMFELTAVKKPFGNAFFHFASARLANKTGQIPENLVPEIQALAQRVEGVEVKEENPEDEDN